MVRSKNDLKLWIFLLVIAVLLAVPVVSDSSLYYYVGAALITVVSMMYANGKLYINSRYSPSRYPAVYILVFGFGIIVGFTRGNDPALIFHDFLGTLLFALYYVLFYFLPQQRTVMVKLIVRLSYLATIEMAISLFQYKMGSVYGWPLSAMDVNRYTQSVTSVIEILVIVCGMISIWNVLEHNSCILLNAIFAIISFWIVVLGNDRGGYLLAYSFSAIFLIIPYVISKGRGNYHNLIIVLCGCFLVFVSFAIIQLTKDDSIYHRIFDMNDWGNRIRLIQFKMVFGRLRLFGNGLGALYTKDYLNNRMGHVIEVSYLDIIDKYGLLSMPIFVGYIKDYWKNVKVLSQRRGDGKRAIVSLGLLSYLLVAVGNPVLYLAYNVICHCISIYISEEDRQSE